MTDCKICSICKAEKLLTLFNKQASAKDGHSSFCKECKKVKARTYFLKNHARELEKMRAYREANPEKVAAAKKKCYEQKKPIYAEKSKQNYRAKHEERLAQSAVYRAENSQKIRDRDAAYKQKNRDELNRKQSEYQARTWDVRKVYHNEYAKRRYKTDEMFALKRIVRRRVTFAFKNNGYTKDAPTAEMVGCDWDALKRHLESQFVDGMTWANRSLWHVDHKIPLASANSKEELLALCRYTNLQPLWAEDNLSKGAKMPHEL